MKKEGIVLLLLIMILFMIFHIRLSSRAEKEIRNKDVIIEVGVATIDSISAFNGIQPMGENAYAIYIEFVDIKKWREWIQCTSAKHKAEVHIEYEGKIKEYTFNEFFHRLGFE